MWNVVAVNRDGVTVWTAWPFDTKDEANAYMQKAAEKGWNTSDQGEVLKMVVEADRTNG